MSTFLNQMGLPDGKLILFFVFDLNGCQSVAARFALSPSKAERDASAKFHHTHADEHQEDLRQKHPGETRFHTAERTRGHDVTPGDPKPFLET